MCNSVFGVAVLTAGLLPGYTMAADYWVGIVNPGTGVYDGGSAINLYSTTASGNELIQTYILHQKDYTGNLASVLLVAMNPAHTFVYVVYSSTNVPNIVGFRITANGLVKEWEQGLPTGDSGLYGGANVVAGPSYVIENDYTVTLRIDVVSQAGVLLLDDYEAGFTPGGTYLISGHVDSTRTYYYSCQSLTSSPPATLVQVFKFEDGAVVNTYNTTPVATSTDSVYVNTVCGQ